MHGGEVTGARPYNRVMAWCFRRLAPRLIWLSVLAIATTGNLAGSAAAVPGMYDVYSCALPNGRAAPIDGWRLYRQTLGQPGFVNNGCPAGSGLLASLSGETDTGDNVGWVFDAPYGTTVEALGVYRAERAGAGNGFQVAYLAKALPDADPLTREELDWCGPVSGDCLQRGDFSSRFAPSNHVEFTGIASPHLYAYVHCVGLPTGCAAQVPPGEIVIFSARIGLRDLVVPTIAENVDGSLLTSSEPVEGERTVSLTARDEGGGLASVGVLVDGVAAVQKPADATSPTCRRPYLVRVPCPLAASVTLPVQTSAIPNGRHIVQAFATDVGGNRTTSRPFLVTTQNGGEPNGVGASRLAELSVGRAGHPASVLRYRARTTLRGRLQVPSGAPISGAVVRIHVLTALRGARWRDAGSVTTDAQGRFRYVAGAGPSRSLRMTYHAFSLDPEPAATTGVDLRVRAGLAFSVRPRRVSSRGLITFRGKLLGGPGRAGNQVALYAVARRGRDRVPVAVVRTDRRGRFRFAYRFRRTFAPFTYRFRAKLPTQPGYPYVGTSSRTVTVRVTR
jgi:hypothetical protein